MGGRSVPASQEADDDFEEDEEEEEEGADSDDDAALFGFEAEAAAQGAGIDDDEDFGQVLSPFGPETFPSADACWAHAESVHGFSLQALRRTIGTEVWSDYHRIRLVNHLRRLGPESARDQAGSLTADSPIWADDALLMPVLEDDLLLFDAGEESDEEVDVGTAQLADRFGAESVGGGKGKGGGKGVSKSEGKLAAAVDSSSSGAGYAMQPGSSADEELVRRRLEVTSLGRALVSADEATSSSSLSGEEGRRRLAAARALRGSAEALRQWLSARRDQIDGRTVLNAGCSSGVMGLVCAQLGAETVVSVDSSVQALSKASDLAEANGMSGQVRLLRGQLDEDLGAEGLGIACDGLLSERLFEEPRLSPLLPGLLFARRRHWRSGPQSWVFPRRVSLHLQAGDFSRELEEREALASCLGGLNLTLLGSDAMPPSSVEAAVPSERLTSEGRIVSTAAAQLLSLDMATANPEDALPSRAPFRLELRPDRCVTALLLELRLEPGMGEAADATSPPAVQTVLHLPASGAESRALRLPGSEFLALEGYLSAGALPAEDGGGLEVAVAFTATRREADAGARETSVSGSFKLPP